ncbi:MAG: hypothetical protein ACJAXX_001673 [Roseivirga sp.]|jgi:hypothetical protein
MRTLIRISKPVLLAAIMVIFATTAFGQAKEKREISGVKELSVSDAFAVEIRIGNQESLEIEIDEDYMDDVITEVRGGRLFIKMRNQSGRKSYRLRETPRVYLTVKSLKAINASGAVTIKSKDIIKGSRLDIEVSGASVLDLEINVDDLYLEASGASVLTLEGRAKVQEVKTSGATTYSAYELESEVADIRVNGAGTAKVNVSQRLDVRAAGASSIRYRGNPSVNSDTSGASSVRKGE